MQLYIHACALATWGHLSQVLKEGTENKEGTDGQGEDRPFLARCFGFPYSGGLRLIPSECVFVAQ